MTSEDVLALAWAALTKENGTTDAAARVYRPGDWPSQPGQYPALKLRVIGEEKASEGRASLNFTVRTTLRIIGEVSEPAQLDDAGATAAESALWRLQRQYECAIINDGPLFAHVQQLVMVRTQLAFNSEAATHLAGIQSDMVFEFYQGPEDFAPMVTTDIEAMTLAATQYPPAGFRRDFPS